MKKLLNKTILAFIVSTVAIAQQVSGTVTEAESGAPLPGATVVVKGTNNGTTTDFDGVFQLYGVAENAIIVISYIGFENQEILVGNNTNISISLAASSDALDEIVVIGYGSQRKKEVTGAVSVLDAKSIERLNPVRAEQAIQGQVPGVNITSQSGSPGSGFNIRIRGITTNGDNAPLILVDGNRIVDLNAINPNDIATINIIKDATAGIYGVLAANGVILITTKSGGKNTDLTFQLSTYAGLQQTSKKIDLMNSFDFAQYVNDAADKTEYFVYPQSGTDWQDEVFEEALMSEVNLSGYGGGEKSSYSFGVSYLDQDGIVGGSKNNYERITGRLNYKYDILDNLELSANVLYFEATKQNLQEGGIGAVLYNAVNLNPTMPVYDADGNFALANDVSQIELINPVAQIANTFNTARASRLSGIFGLEYTFWKNVTVTSKLNYNHATVLEDVFRPEQNYGNGKGANITGNEVIDNGANYTDWMLDNFLTYENTFNDTHNLKVLLGSSLYQTEGLFFGNTGRTTTGTNQLGQTVWDSGMTVEPRFNDAALANGADWFDVRLSSLFTRVQYSFQEKYLFSAALRRDVSSRFSTINGNNVGYFPSGSVGWNVSEESFMQNIDWINQLKIRGSYGIIGNDRSVAPFSYITSLNGQATVDPGTGVTGIDDLLYGSAAGTLGNISLKWEEQETVNVGVDLRMFDQNLVISADAFRKKTKDLLLSPQASALTGISAPGSGVPFVNAGTVQNQGIELAIGYYGSAGDDFNYNINYNFTTIENKVISLNGRTTPVGGEYGVGLGITDITRMAPGFALGHYFGYKTNGIYQTKAEIELLDAAFLAASPDGDGIYHDGAAPGDLRFVDTNGDGEITDKDRTNIGDPIPDFQMGLNFGFTYKSFDFNAYAFASLGHELVRDYERKDLYANRGTYMLERWQGSGTSNTIPRAVSGANINTDEFSDFHVEDASFLRLQNVQLGYDFTSLLKNTGLKKFRVYVSGNNLFTITDYNGYDPAANSGAALGGGIDKGFYPVAKTYLLGLNIDF